MQTLISGFPSMGSWIGVNKVHPRLKPGRVTRVKFCEGQPGQTRIIKYPGLTRFGVDCSIRVFRSFGSRFLSAELLPILLSFIAS